MLTTEIFNLPEPSVMQSSDCRIFPYCSVKAGHPHSFSGIATMLTTSIHSSSIKIK